MTEEPPELAAALAWAGEAGGSDVVGRTRLTGGMTSWICRLDHADGSATVLRLVTEQPWRRHGPELVAREAWTQRVLAPSPVPAPRSIAATEDVGGLAAHLMSLLPGATDTRRRGRGPVTALARLLAQVHDVVADPAPRTFQSWAVEEKRVVPGWSQRPGLWRRAFAALAMGDPSWEPTFLQRDFGPRNVLWAPDADEVTGVVDWVETSTGPAWLDVAHGSSNLALRHGAAEGVRLARRTPPRPPGAASPTGRCSTSWASCPLRGRGRGRSGRPVGRRSRTCSRGPSTACAERCVEGAGGADTPVGVRSPTCASRGRRRICSPVHKLLL